MFTWVCPQCGSEVDVAENSCPRCQRKLDAETEAFTDPPPRRKETPHVAPQAAGITSQSTVLALFAVAVIAALGLAYYFSQPRGLVLEDVPEDAIAEPDMGGGRGRAGEIEVAELRFRYDDQFTPLVQAVVINHGNQELSGVKLAVKLNTVEAPLDASPLATFEITLQEPLTEQASAEVESTMLTAGTLAALPPADRLRVEVERLN